MKTKLALVAACIMTFGAQAALAKDICAPIAYSGNAQAQAECPAVCAGVTFNGQWTNQASNVAAAGCTAGV